MENPQYVVHVVNMRKHTDRWDRVSTRLRDKGFTPVWSEGYDVSKLDLEAMGFKTGKASNGTMGCAYSHIALWERLVASGLPAMVVCEDDAVPLATPSEVAEFLASAPPDADLIHLGCDHGCTDGLVSRASLFGLSMISGQNRCAPHAVNAHFTRIGFFGGTHAYVVTRGGASKLLRHMGRDVSYHVDHMMGRVPGIVMYATRRELITYEFTGVCTGSALTNGGGQGLKCVLDRVPIGRRSLGYYLFIPVYGKYDLFTLLTLLAALLVAAWLLRRSLMAGTRSARRTRATTS